MTAKSPIVAAAWDEFLRQSGALTLPPGARKQLRRAFYAGALLVLDALGDGMSDEDHMTESDEQLLRGVHAELADFGERIRRGEA